MTLTQREYEQIEDEIIDPQTGEIISSDPREDDLPRIARALKSINRKIDRAEEMRRQQIEQINADFDNYVQQRETTRDILLQKARLLVEQTEDQKYKVGGVGTFRFRKLPPKVDDTDYREVLTEIEIQHLHKDMPQYFVTKVAVSPDKKAIKEALANGEQIPGFSLPEREPVFELA